MIGERELLEAIAECQNEKNPDSKTCMKLASYYTILNNMYQGYSYDEPPQQVRYKSGSEFSDVIQGMDVEGFIDIMDELMDTIRVLSPRLYKATLEKLHYNRKKTE